MRCFGIGPTRILVPHLELTVAVDVAGLQPLETDLSSAEEVVMDLVIVEHLEPGDVALESTHPPGAIHVQPVVRPNAIERPVSPLFVRVVPVHDVEHDLVAVSPVQRIPGRWIGVLPATFLGVLGPTYGDREAQVEPSFGVVHGIVRSRAVGQRAEARPAIAVLHSRVCQLAVQHDTVVVGLVWDQPGQVNRADVVACLLGPSLDRRTVRAQRQ